MQGNFTVNSTYTIPENDFEVSFYARGTHYHDNGRMYMPNGDPGYPPYDEVEVDSIDIESIINDEGEDILSKYSEEEIDSLCDTITDKIIEGDYDLNYVEPEEPEE